uniref:ATP synthase F0 subunit 8 n=1 Tax=Scolytoplatypus wugongshanensis TaxID=2894162 RepID=UPI0023AB39AB|nr:ATP synthase F0 subunit 8 [Scolytoplatypus wugongshanensis]WCB99738.1 ATP synthase F0 subunit 8 [Scolytoplatypus wugongshanensis]
MPQMAPMNWTSLLIMFILLFSFYSIICFFLIHYKHLETNLNKTNKSLTNWKW